MEGLAYTRLIHNALYRPVQTSARIANGIGVIYEKKTKVVVMIVAFDCPNPNAPGKLELFGGFWM